ncbi:putative nonaspanin (TM9SF) [Helianthus debilis subsp. tardiflorus]
MLFIALLLICLGSHVESDASNHRFNKGDIVPFYPDTVCPLSDSRETYAYYDLPYCSPDTVKKEKLNLGEMMNGDLLVSTPYKFEFLVDKDYEVLCNKTLSKTDVSKFINAIEKNFYMQLYFDDLPIWDLIGSVQNDYTNEGIKSIYVLNTHFEFQVFYNKDRVIAVTLLTADNSLYISEDKEVDVGFTYSVRWIMETEPFDKRMDRYIADKSLQHNLSLNFVAFSFVTLVILVILLRTFYVQVLHKDIYKYYITTNQTQL